MEERIIILFQKYLKGEASSEELKAIQDYFPDGDDTELTNLIQAHLNAENNYIELSEKEVADHIVKERWENISEITLASENKKILLAARWTAIAALLIGLLLGAMYYLTRPETEETKLISAYGSDVLPGSNRATLSLADGTKIELDNSSNGIQVTDKTIVYNDGSLVTENNANSTATLSVPNGGIYRLTLSDGTKVVLNSGSSLSYPLIFSDSIRSVTLDGEGYFEVTPNKSKPFKVKTERQLLTVLGTHFNIQSYQGELSETTLLEGRVSLNMSGTNNQTILVPNQQAVMRENKYQVMQVNGNEAIAWANNLFVFNNTPLSQIFKSIERWYNVEINYPQSLDKNNYLMEIPKDRKLSEVLSSISDLTGIKFKIEGRRVTVTAK